MMYKALDKWLLPYLRSALARPPKNAGPIDILVAVCDHFEPLSPGGNKPHALGVERVSRWRGDFPVLAQTFWDADGVHPQHSFFFPIEEAHADFLQPLAQLTRQGFGEVEIHLHHRHDTAENLRRTLNGFRDELHEDYGLLGTVDQWSDDRASDQQGNHGPWVLGRRERGEEKRELWQAEEGVKREALVVERGSSEEETTDGHGYTRMRKEETAKDAKYTKEKDIESGEVNRWCTGFSRNQPRTATATPNPEPGTRNQEQDVDRRSWVVGREGSEAKVNVQHSINNGQNPPDSGQRTTNNGRRKNRPVFAFIHGNWALCNSRPDGDWCGVDNELAILKETGCYADLTFPAIPAPCQPKRFCNSIYLAKERGRRSHDAGRVARVGTTPDSDELLMIQGPAAFNWKWRKWGVLPRIEHADVSGANPPNLQRADLWIRQHIHVAGQPNWIFVKLHTHGCIERNSNVLLGDAMRQTHQYLQAKYNDGQSYRLHYVTAREMANIAFAAMAGKTGNPGDYRDFIIAPPACKIS